MHVVSFTTPVVLGVCSYWFASIWIRNQQRGQSDMMPTPVQYGLLVGLCRSSGLVNAYDAARYMMQSKKKRPAVSSILVSAFVVVVVMLFINYTLSYVVLYLTNWSNLSIYAVASLIFGCIPLPTHLRTPISHPSHPPCYLYLVANSTQRSALVPPM